MNTTQTTLGPKPANPAEIRFSADCFVTDGYRTEFSVCLSAPSYPVKFGENREAAEAFARKCKRVVSERRVAILRRVKWK